MVMVMVMVMTTTRIVAVQIPHLLINLVVFRLVQLKRKVIGLLVGESRLFDPCVGGLFHKHPLIDLSAIVQNLDQSSAVERAIACAKGTLLGTGKGDKAKEQHGESC